MSARRNSHFWVVTSSMAAGPTWRGRWSAAHQIPTSRAVRVGAVETLEQLDALEVVVLVRARPGRRAAPPCGAVRAGAVRRRSSSSAEVLEQPDLLLAEPTRTDVRRGVGQVRERPEVARAHVEDDEVEVVGRVLGGQRQRDARQRGAGAAAGDAEQQQVALVEVPAGRDLPLPLGLVGERRPGRGAGHATDGGPSRVLGRGSRRARPAARATPDGAGGSRPRGRPPRSASMSRSRSVGARRRTPPQSRWLSGRRRSRPAYVDQGGGRGLGSRPVTRAVCTGVMSSWPSLTKARPCWGRPMADAAGTPMTLTESSRLWTRSATRRLVLARMSSLTTPEGAGSQGSCGPRACGRRRRHRPATRDVGILLGEHRELVDDEQQSRHRLGGSVAR